MRRLEVFSVPPTSVTARLVVSVGENRYVCFCCWESKKVQATGVHQVQERGRYLKWYRYFVPGTRYTVLGGVKSFPATLQPYEKQRNVQQYMVFGFYKSLQEAVPDTY